MPKGGPAVERAMAVTLRTNLNAQLDAVWADWATFDTADGIVVPKVYPLSVFAGYRREIPEYPVVVVSSIGGRVEEDGMQEGAGWQQIAHQLDVAWICASDDVHVLDQQVQRYKVAVWETLMHNPNLDNSLNGTVMVTLESYGVSEVFKSEQRSHLLMQGAAWRVVARLDESA